MINRRNFIKIGALGSAGLALSPRAFTAMKNKVYLDYTQQELDDAYDNSKWADPDFRERIKAKTTDSAKVRESYPPQTFAYGPEPSSSLDVFAPANAKGLPMQVFIHGGAWKKLTKDDVSTPAPTFVDAGGIYIALNFDVIPNTTLPGMVAQIRRALVWIQVNAERFGGDPEQIFVSGSSSGGHLTAMMLTTDWTTLGAPHNLLKGGLVISGMCDLRPVMLSARGSYLLLDTKAVEENSPIDQIDNANCPIVVAHGSKESPEFKRQSEVFAKALKNRGRLEEFFKLPGMDHFTMGDQLNDPTSPLSQAALRQMKLVS